MSVRLFDRLIETDASFAGMQFLDITFGNLPIRLNVVGSSGTFTIPTPGLVLQSGSITAVPEPSSLLLLAIAGVTTLGYRRHHCRSWIARLR